jgi:hypothetical protein
MKQAKVSLIEYSSMLLVVLLVISTFSNTFLPSL